MTLKVFLTRGTSCGFRLLLCWILASIFDRFNLVFLLSFTSADELEELEVSDELELLEFCLLLRRLLSLLVFWLRLSSWRFASFDCCWRFWFLMPCCRDRRRDPLRWFWFFLLLSHSDDNDDDDELVLELDEDDEEESEQGSSLFFVLSCRPWSNRSRNWMVNSLFNLLILLLRFSSCLRLSLDWSAIAQAAVKYWN